MSLTRVILLGEQDRPGEKERIAKNKQRLVEKEEKEEEEVGEEEKEEEEEEEADRKRIKEERWGGKRAKTEL